ncbi:LacI family DNA-binding transcriptional regulator [Marisediminicola senii]|uniref:LacI family DNA-binding transcriptional regulator n=1 Tax=Marisediminicola senii TaxID=2711233 RepID=UPI0013EA890D|nr:LacI family DNA-binding transcriptional regulator [Marisediminicola senii]
MTHAEPEPRLSRSPTLKDVAQLAGVSVATASKALSGGYPVSAQTRSRVMDAAQRISFTPNVLAQGLLSGQTGTVGLITGELDGRFSIPILMGAEDAFGTGNVSIFLCDARADSIREQFHLRALLSRRVDGLIVVGSKTNPRASLGQNIPVPVVYAYAPSDDARDISVVPDNVQAGFDAAEHLVRSGRKNILHIAGDEDYAASIDRAAGITAALNSHNLGLVGNSPWFGAWTEEWGRLATAQLLASHHAVDAILCGSDQIARGVMDILRESGIDIPAQVAVMGFDNREIFTLASRPPLSSVDMNLESLGKMAAKRLVEAIAGNTVQGIESLPCRVVARESTDGSPLAR